MYRNFGVVVALVLFCVSYGYTEDDLPPVTPHKPVLSKSVDTELCGRFASASLKSLSSKEDWQAAFPEAKVFSFPPTWASPGKFFHLVIDFDGDREKEVLHIEPHDAGWRYGGMSLYLFEDEEDSRQVKAISEKYRHTGSWTHLATSPLLNPAPTRLYNHSDHAVLFVLSLNGAVYTPSSHDGGRSVRLVQLNGQDGPQESCILELLPKLEELQGFITESEFFQALRLIQAGPHVGCLGTIGWGGIPLERVLQNIFHRPNTIPDSEQEDAARELRLLSWGVSDPMSWSFYTRLKGSQTKFLQRMTNYYRRYFVKTDSEAQVLAAHAYRHLVDSVFYRRSSDKYELTCLTSKSQLNIGLDSSPEEVARTAVEGWQRAAPAEGECYNSYQSLDALLAALYTRQDSAQVSTLWERILADRERVLTDEGSEDDRESTRGWFAWYLNKMLLAALGDQVLSELILSFDADVNASTNWFRKTALMYAAQTNDLAALRFLLTNGANPSAQTSVDDDSCRDLERDRRTPLMYAAENGSSALIVTLLEAGADLSAADSQGNTAAWYLERNRNLRETEKTLLRERLSLSP